MNAYISILGLVLDLIGVLILGYDIIRLQRAQKEKAARDARFLSEAFEDNGDYYFARTALHTGVGGSDGFDWDGGVDADALHTTLVEFKEAISRSNEGVINCIEYLANSVDDAQKAAHSSLSLTYGGLFLICCGFALQILGLTKALGA